MLRESSHVSLSGAGRDWPGKEPLNRALVAGLLLEVIFSPPNLPEDPQARRCQVKSRLKNTLVSRLAGHIPLDSFRDLAQNLDQWFDFFYPLISPPCSLAIMIGKTGNDLPRTSQPIREDLLRDTLDQLSGLLPTRRHRKIDGDKLLTFFRQRGGDWFRLKDFEHFFRIDRKTAWEYTQKFLQAGFLTHNQERSAAVRYRLGSRFLASEQPAVSSQ
jgi:hypothetical protein